MVKATIDYETRSVADLKRVGVYRYAEDSSTEALCLGYAVDDGPVRVWAPGDDDREVKHILKHADTLHGHNFAFERIITNSVMTRRHGWPRIAIERGRCSMTQAYALGLPGALNNACAAVGMPGHKDMTGHRLMLAMCKPRFPRKGDVGPGPFWRDTPADRKRLCAYCVQDVEAERALEKRLLPLKPSELELWFLDQKINDRGIFVDAPLCEAAIRIVDQAVKKLNLEMFARSGGEVRGVTDLAGLTRFCKARGLPGLDSLAKDRLAELLAREDLDSDVRRCLEIRSAGGRTSVSKIRALIDGRGADGRARGFLQFHAANTGRWAGRRFQPQNLKRPEAKNQVEDAIGLILDGDADMLELVHGPALSIIGDTIRGMVRAAPDARLTAADYSNIEGRVLAWLAGERWKVDAFRAFDAGAGPDIYRLGYARSFGVRLDAVTDGQRQIGKVQELALGYQGGPGAFQVMAQAYGVRIGESYALMRELAPDAHAEAEDSYAFRGRASGATRETWVAAETVKLLWRAAHPATVSLWADMERAAILAVDKPGAIVTCGRLKFRKAGSWLFMLLPSGRAMAYPYPLVMDVPYFESMKRGLTYKTVPDPLKPGKIIPEPDGSINMNWARISTYGGMMVENAVQAIARDILAAGMTALDAAGYGLVLHVHDEPVSEDPIGFGSEAEFVRLMTTLPDCYAGLPIAAGSFQAERYRK